MKKLVISFILNFVIFTFVACSQKTLLKEMDNVKNTSQSHNINVKSDSTEEEIKVLNDLNEPIVTSNVPEELDKESEEPNNTYTVHHEKDNSNYIVYLIEGLDSNYEIRLYDEESNLLQNIELGRIPGGIDFMDVNLDSYTDIVANTGGTVNESHEFYIWDISSINFIKVNFEGFDMLSFFSVYDGYIENFIRGSSPEDSDKEKLIWEGNTLIKVTDDTGLMSK